jgi:TRAP-type C4-dicarboxylate transport system permease small subunit
MPGERPPEPDRTTRRQAAAPPVVHIADGPVDLSDQTLADAPVLVVFWGLAFVVFLQFFTRYVLNDSLGWTEEIARVLLIVVTFLGAIMAVRKQSHIAVELLYRYLTRPMRRALQAFVDLGSTIFFAALAAWCAQLAGNTFQMLVSIDLPKAWLYWKMAACFALMAMRQAQAAWRHLRTGTSRLIDPDLDPGGASSSAPLME